MTAECLIIGVDGGGTGCRVAIAMPDLTIIGRGHSGPANPTTDFDQAVASVTVALDSALASAGIPPDDVSQARAHLGLAGIMEPTMAARIAADLPFRHAVVTDDRITTLAGALGGDDGAVASIGTGSFAGISRGSIMRLVGGWGSVLGDEASGAWLGRHLLSWVCAAQDGIAPSSDLTGSVLASFDGSAGRIPGFAATARPSDFAAFAPQIVAAAGQGDQVACRLMEDGAAWIARAIETLGFEPGLPFCLTGGLGSDYKPWLPATLAAVLVPPQGNALDGALHLARRALDR